MSVELFLNTSELGTISWLAGHSESMKLIFENLLVIEKKNEVTRFQVEQRVAKRYQAAIEHERGKQNDPFLQLTDPLKRKLDDFSLLVSAT